MANNEKCKKCGLSTQKNPGTVEWCACEVGIDIDENGEPLDTCRDHGVYSGGSCPGCDEEEDQIDRAIERDHEKGGRYDL